MIDVTELIIFTRGFTIPNFTKYYYEKALKKAKCHEKKDRWFTSTGVFVGDTMDDACRNLDLRVESERAKEFYAVKKAKAKYLITAGELVKELHGTYIWGRISNSVEVAND